MKYVRLLVCCIVGVLVPDTASAAQSFVYVPAPVCADAASCAPELFIYDATTAGLAAKLPLPVGSSPTSIAVSRDGTRVYVASAAGGGAGFMTVVDATRHQLLGVHPVDALGAMSVSRDGARVFIASGTAVAIYDTATNTIVSRIQTGNIVTGVAASPTRNRIYTSEWSVTVNGAPGSRLDEYDTDTGALVPGSPARAGESWIDLFLSRDGTRIYATTTASFAQPAGGGGVSIFDPATWTQVAGVHLGFPTSTVDAPARGSFYLVWSAVGIQVIDTDTLFSGGFVPAPGASAMAVSADETRGWVATRIDNTPGSTNELHVVDLATNTVASTIPLSGPSSKLAASPPGANICAYQVDTTQSSWTVNGGTASIAVKTPCAWATTSDAPWARLSSASGSGDATLTVTVDQNFTTTNRSATLSIGGRLVHVTQASFSATPAFGLIDTPADNVAGVSGALNVSGWALDDVGVTRVRVFRDPVAGEAAGTLVFIGDATFVDGARPDVQAIFPAFPNASRAGWGLQILTNLLPGQGNGIYRLSVYAEDVEGHTSFLGTRMITCTNAGAISPFGTIDTPGQGATVSGTIVNFGWALTPQPKMIPIDGSTIDVLIDGLLVGHPSYGFPRADIQTLFPGYANTDTAVGFFVLDTTTLANGLHSIAWVVRDSAGATQGIGSRFFMVANP